MGGVAGHLVMGNDFVNGGIRHDLVDQREVHGVAGFFGDHVTEERLADEGQIANEVERLVAAALIDEAEAAGVENGLAIEADGVIERGAADQAHVAHLVELIFEAEGAGGSEFSGVFFGRDFHIQGLTTYQGVREEYFAGQQEAVRWKDADALASAFHRYRFANAEVTFSAARLADTGGSDEIHEGLAAAVKNRNFEVIDLDEGVVDAHAVEGAEKVLGGGDQHALAHQASGVADLLHIAPTGGDGEAFEIGADENDASAGRGREDADANGNAGMEADSGGVDRTVYSFLKIQIAPPLGPGYALGAPGCMAPETHSNKTSNCTPRLHTTKIKTCRL